MIKRILAATDGSEQGQQAAAYAVDLSGNLGSGLTILSVIDLTALSGQSIPGRLSPTHLIEPVDDLLKQTAEEYMKEIEEKGKKLGIPVRKVIRRGNAVEEIVLEARESKADLIVLGSRGRSMFKSILLGSVTLGVLHHAHVPVLIFRK
ncbi:MAG: universal stress protein [Syntrophales bacterium]